MHWSSVLIVLAIIIAAFVLYVRGEKKILYHILFLVVTEVERMYGSGTGKLKKAAAISILYKKLPAILKLFLTEQRLSELIEEALDYAKIVWAENAEITNYINGYEIADAEESEVDDVIDKPPDEVML